jgi:hypothetical protein
VPESSYDDANCDYCCHAAFDEGGVYCKLFHEPIFSPVVVAAECGEYEPTSRASHPAVTAKKKNLGLVVVDDGGERERVLHLELNVPFYGKPAHGDRLTDAITRIATLNWPQASINRKEP